MHRGKWAALAVAAVLCAAPAWADDVTVAVETKDGRTVEGVLQGSSFKMQTDFGSAVVDADKVATIRFGEPDILVTSTDVELRGRITLSSLRLRTADGRVTVKRSDLVALTRTEGGRPSGAADFTGEWSGSWGPMTLKQRGLTVEGTYGFNDEFQIEGKVQGRELAFTYREPSARGSGTFELWEDGDVFTGTFQANGATDSRFWGGYRIRARAPEPRPGEVVEGQSKSWLNYHLRVPKGWDGKRPYPAIAFFHGSNMSSRAYVDTLASRWPELAEDYVLVGFDGEKLSSASTPGDRRFNFTYINYSGPDWGAPFIRRQSPALVGEALEELGEHYGFSKWFVGGHSQGGFLTYAVVMYFPELVAGAFPMSCNLLVQCEPDNFQDEEARAAQRRVALAPIHGENDGVVEFSSGVYCYERMQDGGFPALRFFTSGAGHEFALLPVEEAVRWLEAMASEDGERLVALAEERFRAREYRDALAALARARQAGGREHREAIDALAAKIESKAEAEAEKLAAVIRANPDARWVDDFWAFRLAYEGSAAFEPVRRAYARLRESHAKPADELFHAARNEPDEGARNAKYREILESYYASKWYPLVKRWLD